MQFTENKHFDDVNCQSMLEQLAYEFFKKKDFSAPVKSESETKKLLLTSY